MNNNTVANKKVLDDNQTVVTDVTMTLKNRRARRQTV